MNITVIDIIMLENIKSKTIIVENPNFDIRGNEIYCFIGGNEIENEKVISVVKKLKFEGLIEESDFYEELEYLTKFELSELLSSMGLATSGIKSNLVDRIIDFNNSHESQIISETRKSFYKITDKGIGILEKHRNLIWFNKNKYKIFNNRFDYGISERDFLKNTEVEIENYLTNRFKEDSYVLSNICFFFEKYEESFHYLVESLMMQLDKGLDKENLIEYKFGDYGNLEYDFSNLLNYINVSDSKIKVILTDLFNKYSNVKENINLESLCKLLIPIISGKTSSFSELNNFLDKFYRRNKYIIKETPDSYNRDAQFLYTRLNELNLEMAEIIEELKSKT